MHNRVVIAASIVTSVFAFERPAPRAQDATVDAATFISAFHAGDAKNYVGTTVKGIGTNFTGMSIDGRPVAYPGKNAYAQVVVMGAIGADGKLAPLVKMADFTDADHRSEAVAIWLTGPNVPRGETDNLPKKLEFSGKYNGVGRWLARKPPLDKKEAFNPGDVCTNQPPTSVSFGGRQGPSPVPLTAFHCVPVLTDAEVKNVASAK